MAILRHLGTRAVHPVPARMLVGRSSSCALRLSSRRVSGEHATLAWTGMSWEVRDLGSRNGTFLDGRRLAAGNGAALRKGSRLAFADKDDAWEVADDGPPSAMATDAASGDVRAAEAGLLALPEADRPEVAVYADAHGRWVVEERGEDPRPARDHDILQAGGRSWELRVPEAHEGTAQATPGPALETSRLVFDVSRDEEHVAITVEHADGALRLEPREHGYVLLTLARARLEDAALPESERGWVDRDELAKRLRMETNALNVAIWRARQQFLAAGIEGSAGLVEVRRGQRRIGAERLEVRKA